MIGPVRGRSLFRRVLIANAVVLAGAVIVLALAPATVSDPITVVEVVVLVVALCALLPVNVWIMRRAFGPLERLTAQVRDLDAARPGQRVQVDRLGTEASELALALNAALDRLEVERRGSAGRALAAQEAERLRVAQELHDQVGQSLTAILLHLGRIARRLPPGPAGELGEVQDAARDALEDVRRIARELRPEALDDLGLLSALRTLVRRLEDQTGLTVLDRLPTALQALDREQELVLYRVAQEALSNVVRHAGTGGAELTVLEEDGQVVLVVRDDGRGLRSGAAGTGLRGMLERAALVGGDLEVTEPGTGGVEIRLTVPLGRRPAWSVS